MSDKDTLTELQAFQAMGKFLEQYIPFNTPSDAVDALKSGIQVHDDGSIENLLFWKEWLNSTNKCSGSNLI